MFAPKFRSWLTDEERFSEALDYRLGLAADAAIKEIREMARAAMVPEPDEYSQEDWPPTPRCKQWPPIYLLPTAEQVRNQSSSQAMNQSAWLAYHAPVHSVGLPPPPGLLSALLKWNARIEAQA